MARRHKFLTTYFVVIGALTVIAVIPGGTLIALLVTGMALPLFGLPGFLVAAAPTILIYSLALLPLLSALKAGRRGLVHIVPALLVPAAVAMLPGILSRHEAVAFADRMARNDFVRPPSAKPRSIELIGDLESGMFSYGEEVGDKRASCNDICRRLLLNDEVAWVRMTHLPSTYMDARKGPTWSATYRLEHRPSCPQLYPAGTVIDKAVRDRLVGGDCLVLYTTDDAAEATARFVTNYFNQSYPAKPPKGGPATIITVKELSLGRNAAPILRRTETVARPVATPFYIGTEMHMQGGYNGPTIGRDKTVSHPIDVAQILRDTFGFAVGDITAPPPKDPAKIAEAILALTPDDSPTLSAQQQDVIKDVLNPMVKQAALSDADVDFIRRVVSDKRITEAQVGLPLQDMFRRFTARLEPLIPAVLERLRIKVDQQVGHYNSMLGWSLTNFQADTLRPYREAMIAVAEAQADWPSSGVLTRLAELGNGAGVDLVIRRMDSTTSLRQFAAVAACRASADAWPALEPAVLAHLTPPRRGNRLQDDERPLYLALVRHGKKELAEEMIDKRGLSDTARTRERLAKFDTGFDPKHCRDSL